MKMRFDVKALFGQKVKVLAFALLLSATAGETSAQLTQGRVRATCGAETYTAGSTAPIVVTTAGELCAGVPAAAGGALEATQLSILTAMQIIDDWDETDRAKVNIIAGQVGIAGGTGVDGATVPRVSLATNVPLPAGTNNIGDVDLASAIPAGTNNIGDIDVLSAVINTFPDNEPFNVAQINGVAPLMGAGNTGTGSPRITIATDQAALTGFGVTATGAATSVNAQLMGTRADGGLAAGTAALTAPISCTDSVAIDGAASGNTELVALTASETIYVCGYSVLAAGSVDFQLIYGTGTACATGETNLTGNYVLAAQAGIVDGSDFFRGMKTAVS